MKIIVAALCVAVGAFFGALVCMGWYRDLKQKQALVSTLYTLDDSLGNVARKGNFKFISHIRQRKIKHTFEQVAQANAANMLHAIALGMKAGLSFESAFSLYHSHFSDDLAKACKQAHQTYSSGILSRKDALYNLGMRANNDTIMRFASTIERSLRFGDGAYNTLKALSIEAQDIHVSKIQEKVSKAPVKMLFPTAGLILPAMLLLIMGPVVLEVL